MTSLFSGNDADGLLKTHVDENGKAEKKSILNLQTKADIEFQR